MVRIILLLVASAATVVAGYAAYTYQEGGLRFFRSRVVAASPTTQAMEPFDEAGLDVRGMRIHSGDKPFAQVYDTNGEVKYQFRATKWEPVSETEYKLIEPEMCVFMPGGQKTQVRADDGQLFVEKAGGGNINPKRGFLRGHVMIFIDRTDRNWRRSNPERAAPEQHPDQIIHIWLDEIRFDLDQSWIKSPGTLRVQSSDAEIEGTGLLLAWNERDNRIERLDIEKGKRMELRRGGGIVSFGMPGQEREATEPASTSGPASDKEKARRELKKTGAMAAAGLSEGAKEPAPSAFIERALLQGASANKSLSIDEVYPDPKKAPQTQPGDKRTLRLHDRGGSPSKRIQLFGQKGEKPDGATNKSRPIDTYHAVFEGNVVVEQRRGLKTLGQLSGVDRLELVFDVGERQRKAVQGEEPTSRPADADGTKSPTPATKPAQSPGTTTVATTQPEEQTRLTLLWTGRLSMRPVQVPPVEQTGRRFDAIANGREVHVMDRQGEVACRRLIFRNETEQAWLYGTSDQPVRMWSGQTRKLLGNEIYVDRKTGIAVVNGPGRMVDAREALASIAVPGGEEPSPASQPKPAAQELIEVTWTRQVEMDFGVADITRIDPATTQEVKRRREYVKQAAFRGGVHMKQGDQSISADEIIMSMDVPKDARSLVGPLKAVRATNDVTLVQARDEIRCDKLNVTMGEDESGRNVPKSATADGNVTARQDKRHIQAKDQMSVIIAPIRQAPTTTQAAQALAAAVDPAQLAKVKELAAVRGIKPAEIDALVRAKGLDLDALKAFAVSKKIDPELVLKLVRPRKPKSRLGIIEMSAFGDVVAVDPAQKLDVQAEDLHCSMPDGKTIERATLMAKPNEKARAEFGDYVINGHRVLIDMPRQYAEVPGDGWLRFLSHQALDGRRVDEPVPIEVKWSKQMRLEGRRNTGEFEGDVSASSQASEMKCDRLLIDFVDLPPEEAEKARKVISPDRWQILDKLLGRKPKPKSSADPLSQRFDKKPIGIVGTGDVVVLSSIYDKQDAKRLLSRMRIAGPKLTVDLRNEQLDVIGQGSLLIEDYRLPTQRDGAARAEPSAPKDPLMANLSGRGPSQTAFTWTNSMTYYLGRNLAVLDRQVSMIHLGGGSLAMGDDLAKAMNLDVSKLRMRGREATLTCDNLTVEFLRNDRKGKQAAMFEQVGAAELKRLIATGNIYLEDTGKSLVGEELTYYRDKNEITVRGSPGNDARLFEQDEKTGELKRFLVVPMIRWNRTTGETYVPGARIENLGR
jgi:lipopolysaccharide export system protein LptA